MEGNSSQNKKSLIAKICVAVVAIIAIILLLLKGCSKSPEFTITFDSDGGSVVASQKVKENGKVQKPKDPTKKGYSFAGWYYNDDLYDFDTKVTKDMVLKARWNASDEIAVDGISLNVEDLTLTVGDKYSLEATISPDDATDKELVWKSSDSSIVTVDKDGNIEALKEGEVTITVTTKDGKVKATCKVTVKAASAEQPVSQTTSGSKKKPTSKPSTPSAPQTVPVTGVSINGGNRTKYVGDGEQLTAVVAPDNASNKSVTWSSSNTGVVTVDANGYIHAVGEGTATITVTTADGHQASITVTVNAKYIITFTEIKQEVGSTLQYSVSVTKNGSAFSDYSTFNYNGKNRMYKGSNNNFPAGDINKGITSATIRLNNGSTVNAIVQYK